MTTKEELDDELQFMYLDVKKLIEVKSNEYIPGDEDALANIRRIAARTNETPARICLILAAKHYDSLLHNFEHYNYDTVVSKVDDIVAYLVHVRCFKIEQEKENE